MATLAILALSQFMETWGRYPKARGNLTTWEGLPTESPTTSTTSTTGLPITTSLATLVSSTQPQTTTTRLLDLCPRECREQLAEFAPWKLVSSPAPTTADPNVPKNPNVPQDPNGYNSEEQFTRLLDSLDKAFINLVNLSVWVWVIQTLLSGLTNSLIHGFLRLIWAGICCFKRKVCPKAPYEPESSPKERDLMQRVREEMHALRRSQDIHQARVYQTLEALERMGPNAQVRSPNLVFFIQRKTLGKNSKTCPYLKGRVYRYMEQKWGERGMIPHVPFQALSTLTLLNVMDTTVEDKMANKTVTMSLFLKMTLHYRSPETRTP